MLHAFFLLLLQMPLSQFDTLDSIPLLPCPRSIIMLIKSYFQDLHFCITTQNGGLYPGLHHGDGAHYLSMMVGDRRRTAGKWAVSHDLIPITYPILQWTKAGNTQDKSPVHCRANIWRQTNTCTHIHNLNRERNLKYQFNLINCGGNSGYPEGAHEDTGRTCKLCTERQNYTQDLLAARQQC